MTRPPRTAAPRQVLAVLLAIALALNLGLLVLYYVPAPKRLIGDETYYFGLASAIAAGRAVKHDPLWPPLYGEAMGALFSVTGPRVLAVQLVQIGLWLVTGVFLFQLTKRLVGKPAIAWVALALYLLSPDLMAFSHYLWPETLHLFLLLGGLWLLICHAQRWWAVAASGILFGLAVLIKSLLLPLLPVVLVFVVLVKDRDVTVQARLIRAVLLAGVCLATVAVLLTATAQQRGAVSIAGSTVFNAWVGLNDSARVDTEGAIVGQEHDRFTAAGPDLAARNAVYRAKIGDLLRQQGVAQTVLRQLGKQYFRLFDVSTFLVTQLPGQPRAAYAFEAPALAALLRIYGAVFQATVLVAGAIGMTWLRGRPLNWLHFFVVFIFYNLAVFLVLHVTTRYTIQFLPLWMVFAAGALYGGAAWLRSRQRPALAGFVITRARLVAGAILGVLLLVLCFYSQLFA